MTSRAASGLVLSTLFAVALAGQGRDTLETRVTAEGNEITFEWTKKHPWDADLIARGASLYAEYRDSKGVEGSECLQAGRSRADAMGRRGESMRGSNTCFTGNAVIRRDDRTIHFQLPDTLTAEPSGAVCLILRLPDNRVLPIRRASRRGDDTARFQVEVWASTAARRRRVENLQQRRKAIEAGIATQTTAVADQERSNAARGWRSPEACQTITAAPLAIAKSGRPLAAPHEQDAVARQVCIARVAEGTAELRQVSPPDDIATLLAWLPDAVVNQWLALRGAQRQRFVDDWARYSPTRASYIAKNRVMPHFGTYRDRVPIQSQAHDAYLKIPKARPSDPPIDTKLVLGYLGAKVEAYERCVTDGVRQLDLNYREAMALEATLATMPERLREQEIKSCLGGMEKLAAMRARIAALNDDLSRIDGEITAMPSSAPPPAKRRELNDVLCTP
jgi:hypothetical protein